MKTYNYYDDSISVVILLLNNDNEWIKKIIIKVQRE